MKVPSHRGRSRLKDDRGAPAPRALEVEPVAADIDLLAGQRGGWDGSDGDVDPERPRLPAPHDDRPAARARVPPTRQRQVILPPVFGPSPFAFDRTLS